MRTAIRRMSGRLLDLHRRAHDALAKRLSEARPANVIAPYVLRAHSAASPVKIFHVNGNFAVGGTTQLIVDLIERLSGAYTHEVIAPDAPDPLPYQPVTLHTVPLNDMTALYRLLAAERPAVVHVQYWVRAGDEYVATALWYHAIFSMCAALDIPVVQNVNVPTQPHACPAVVHNVYVSAYVKDLYDLRGTPASVIHPGSDFGHFTRPTGDAPPDDVIGMVYRLDPDKLDPQSIEVFIEVARRRPRTRCLIVGGGQFIDLYQRRVAEAGLTAQFEFTGFVSYERLPEYYRRLSVFVAPVHNESFGQVTPFAMSMELPVAGFRIGALPEILGSDALLTPHGDVAGLADRIITLLDDRPARLATGLANRHRAHAMFSVEAMIEAYRSLYAQVTEDHRGTISSE